MNALTRDLNPGEHAVVDQRMALLRDVEAVWPYNERILGDDECERVVLDRLGDEWQGMRNDRAYLLWSNGRLVEVEPDALSIGSAVRATMPNLAASECDRCRRVGVAGAAVVAVPRVLVPLLLCTNCSAEVERDLFIEETK
jgi:hypothetical protein